MSEWTEAAGSAYLTGQQLQEQGGHANAKIVGTDMDDFPDGRRPILIVKLQGVERRIAVNAGNMAKVSAFLKGRSEKALVGAIAVLGVQDARNPRTGLTGPSVRILEVKP